MTTATRPATHRFGRGILPTMPFAGRMPYSESDLRWLAENPAPARYTAEERDGLDERYAAPAPAPRAEPTPRRDATGSPTADPAAPLYSQTGDVRHLVRIFGW